MRRPCYGANQSCLTTRRRGVRCRAGRCSRRASSAHSSSAARRTDSNSDDIGRSSSGTRSLPNYRCGWHRRHHTCIADTSRSGPPRQRAGRRIISTNDLTTLVCCLYKPPGILKTPVAPASGPPFVLIPLWSQCTFRTASLRQDARPSAPSDRRPRTLRWSLSRRLSS